MSWSLDWFAAEKRGKAGAQIRPVSWTTQWLEFHGAFWFLTTATSSRIVEATDFGADEFQRRDWTDEPFNADPCAAVAAYNATPPVYGDWTATPLFTPPPPPGFPDV
jgi:hypothetical protein